MKVLLVHNAYGCYSGEEAAVDAVRQALLAHGHEVAGFFRGSEEIPRMFLGSLRAFFSGLHSGSSARAMDRCLRDFRPDIVHIHNLYPLISPSVLGVCRRAGVPAVMTLHNYRLACPSGLHLSAGQVCEKCSGGREYWCALRNCQGSPVKSLGYALRAYAARKRRDFLDHVTVYAALTEFQRRRLIAEGYPPERIVVTGPVMAPQAAPATVPLGDSVGFAGRISPEKGIAVLRSAAALCPDIPFKAIGDGPLLSNATLTAPPNLEFLGFQHGQAREGFYDRFRVLVLPSLCFEGFPAVLLEAMRRGKPVVCSRIGGLPEIVEDGATGLLATPGDADDLARKVRRLWDDGGLCRRLGEAGRRKALGQYSPEASYRRLAAVYEQARRIGTGKTGTDPIGAV